MNDREPDFVGKVRQELDRSLTEIDGLTLVRLAEGCRHALGSDKSSGRWLRAPVAVGWALTAACLLLVFTTVFLPFEEKSDGEPAILAEMGLLTEEESFEFFSDIEFYEWLSVLDGEIPPAADASAAGDERAATANQSSIGAVGQPTGGSAGPGLPRISRVI